VARSGRSPALPYPGHKGQLSYRRVRCQDFRQVFPVTQELGALLKPSTRGLLGENRAFTGIKGTFPRSAASLRVAWTASNLAGDFLNSLAVGKILSAAGYRPRPSQTFGRRPSP